MTAAWADPAKSMSRALMRVQVAMQNEKERQLEWVASQVGLGSTLRGRWRRIEFTFFTLVLKCGLNSAAQKTFETCLRV
jgi:hypothetical protein